MALTPLEIHNKEFGTRMRGYDQDEVNEFLDHIIRDYELLLRENKEVKSDLEIVNKKLANYEEMQDSLNRSILVAQDAADRLKENTAKEVEVIEREAESYAENVRQEADNYAIDARKEADNYKADTCKAADEYSATIHKEADNHADILLEEAVLKARKIEDETEALRKQSRVFRQRLQLLIESQLELLTKEEWDNLLVGRPIEYPDTETIAEVEKELEEKVEIADVTAEEMNEEVVTIEEIEEDAEALANDEEVAFKADESYNSEDSEDKETEEYEEGSMPAIELAETAHE